MSDYYRILVRNRGREEGESTAIKTQLFFFSSLEMEEWVCEPRKAGDL